MDDVFNKCEVDVDIAVCLTYYMPVQSNTITVDILVLNIMS